MTEEEKQRIAADDRQRENMIFAIAAFWGFILVTGRLLFPPYG